MSVLNNSAIIGLLGADAAAEEGISRSVRFNSSDSAYLSRTPASNGNRRTWTFSFWTKRGLGEKALLSVNSTSNSKHILFRFESNDTLTFYVGYTVSYGCTTTQVFRDPSAWYHFVLAFDATASGSAKVRIYVNGEEITSFSADTRSSIADQDWGINEASILHVIGRNGTSGATYYSGYLADCFLIDGQALDPTSFGEFDDNGIWQPIEYSGSYGTNGFHLPFSDNSTAAALGTDTSGNGNTWTVNNISVTAGAGNDSVVDVPTNGTASTGGDPGGSTRGNYCTLNPLTNGGTLSNGNLDFTAGAAHCLAKSTFAIPTSGLWYAELTVGSSTNSSVALGFGLGAASLATNAVASSASNSWNFYGYSSIIINRNDGGNTYSGSFAGGDIIQIAVDPANNRAWVGQNNTWRDGSSGTTGNPSTGSNPTFTSLPANLFLVVNAYNNSGYLNCGQRPFAYSPPSGGYKALCTANLPAPVVTKPSEYMDVKLYTGNGSTQTISGLEFSPDLVWMKRRSSAQAHYWYDIIRGTSSVLYSDGTDAEQSISTGLTAFNSDGFSLGSLAGVNANSETYAAWTWDAGSSTVSNTDGSITSSVRANTSAGFSIVTFSMLSGTYTVGHGLNVVPSLLITKGRTFTSNWWVYHTSLGSSQYLGLNSTAAASSLSWGGSPTSSVFTANNNFFTNGQDYVVYAFAPVDGYSSSFSYTGNGSADGPMVWLGFRPKLILLKCSSSTSNWFMYDTVRNTYNVVNYKLYADQSAQENGVSGETTSTNNIDALSNGFKLRSANGSNTSAATYIGFAWAENPFQYARAR